MSSRILWAGLTTALLVVAGCGEDAAVPDASGTDAALDAGTGAVDAAADSGDPTEDVGTVDVGPEDGGSEDIGSADAGSIFGGPPSVPASGRPPRLLSELNLVWPNPDGTWAFNERVVPYELNAPLFSDFSLKDRALYVPAGKTVEFAARGTLDFPVGSAIVKSFSFAPDLRSPLDGRRLIETRVLIKQDVGWRAYPYLWREDQSDADYHVRGDVRPIDFIDPWGAPRTSIYVVPQRNQCLECHILKDDDGDNYQTIIGPTARSLNRDGAYPEGPTNQLEQLTARGMLRGMPALGDIDRAFDIHALTASSTLTMSEPEIERAARDYLDINCAHCHNPSGVQGITSRLFLNYDNDRAFNLGVCKEPGSAGGAARGRKYDIVPGNPDASILWYRTVTEEVGDMMPLVGRSLSDPVGASLLRAWIEQLDEPPCD